MHISAIDIKEARQRAGLTQTQAGTLVHVGCRAWQKWESGEAKMSKAAWELFSLKIKLVNENE